VNAAGVSVISKFESPYDISACLRESVLILVDVRTALCAFGAAGCLLPDRSSLRGLSGHPASAGLVRVAGARSCWVTIVFGAQGVLLALS